MNTDVVTNLEPWTCVLDSVFARVMGKSQSPPSRSLTSVRLVPLTWLSPWFLVSWTWFPRGWWTLSFGRPQKASGRTAQVRPSFALPALGGPLLGCGAGRGASGSLRGEWVQFSVFRRPQTPHKGLESPSKTVDGHLRAVLLGFSIRHTRDSVCVCVCVCVRERERERDQERD